MNYTNRITDVQVENIPNELKNLKRWVAWKWSDVGRDKPTKIPLDAAALLHHVKDGTYPTNIMASSTGEYTWTSFDLAIACLKYGCHGIGFMLGDGWAGIDIDDCVVDGEITEAAKHVLRCLDSYSEISPSGTGIKIIVKAEIGSGRKHEKHEVYSQARFFTITGHRVPWCSGQAKERQSQVESFLNKHFPTQKQKDQAKFGESNPINQDQYNEVLKLAFNSKNGAFTKALWDCDEKEIASKFAKADGSPDWSSAVGSLVYRLAFYTQNPEQLDALFRKSGLFKNTHWEEKWERLGEEKIEDAINDLQEKYEWPTPSIDYSQLYEVDVPEKPKPEKAEKPKATATAPAPALEQEQKQSKPTKYDKLMKLCSKLEIWNCKGRTYATVFIDGIRQNLKLDSTAFRNYCNRVFDSVHHTTPGKDTIASVIDTLTARCQSEVETYKRVARVENTIWIDICNDRWEAIEIDSDGWRIVQNPPVKFLRTPNSGALPNPKNGGNIESLKPLCATTDEGWLLLKGWILQCFQGFGPYVICIINGEQGSAKSSVSAILKRFVDPLKSANKSAAPRNDTDLSVDCENEFCVLYDNVSFIPMWLSDALCRIATGGGLKTRQLYTNGEQYVFDACAPIVLNGIPDFAENGDLLSRAMIVSQPVIDEDERKTEVELKQQLLQSESDIMGGICTMISAGLRNYNTLPELKLPRMADSVKWVTACFGNNSFLDEFVANQADSFDIGIEASPIAPAIIRMVNERGKWSGTASELMNMVKVDTLDQNYPKGVKAFGSRLKRDLPLLRKYLIVNKGRSHGKQFYDLEKKPA